MNDIRLTVNQIVQNKEENFRILWLSPSGETGYWITTTGISQVPKAFSVKDILSDIQNGKLSFGIDAWKPVTANPSQAQLEGRDRAWRAISDIVIQEPAIYTKKERSILLREASVRSGIMVPNLYKYLSRYWKGGKVPNE